MDDYTKNVLITSMTGEENAEVISAYLDMAGEAILNYADPYRNGNSEAILERYSSLQVRAAAYYLNKRGAEGQITHSENGIQRQYEAAELPPSLLREITPIAGAVT